MRYFFNLCGPERRVFDRQGVEAISLTRARQEAVEAIEELWESDPDLMMSFRDFCLEILDCAGAKLAVLDLARATEPMASSASS